MRTREEIMTTIDDASFEAGTIVELATIRELLLDIRDLLEEANRVEIVGVLAEQKKEV